MRHMNRANSTRPGGLWKACQFDMSREPIAIGILEA